MRSLLVPLVLGLGLSCTPRDALVCTEDEGLELYERRIEPILTEDRPKSCNQCHLSGIDLSNFVKETPCQTMACMAEKNLVDLDDPENSLVLSWIERANPDSDLITEDVIQAEYDGFLEWIEFSAQCGGDACPEFEDACGDGPSHEDCAIPGSSSEQIPFEDPGDCSDLTLELVFSEKVYAWRGRCYACHFDSYDGPPEEAPRWIATGECDEGALATMRNIEERGLIDTQDPTQSLILRKPLSEDEGGVWHGGHNKFEDAMDPAYLDFIYWIERYAECED